MAATVLGEAVLGEAGAQWPASASNVMMRPA